MQLSNFLVPLFAALGFAIYEYLHDKTAFNVKTFWIKYVSVYALICFGFSHLLAWKYFQWVAMAALTVLGLVFFQTGITVIKGWLKGFNFHILIPLILVAGMSSCSDKGKVTFTQVDSTQTGWMLVNGETIRAKDTLFTYEPSPAWKLHYATKRGNTATAIVCLVFVLIAFYVLEWKPGNTGSSNIAKTIAYVVLSTGLLITGGSAVDWARANTTQTIDKKVFDPIKDNPKALDSLMDARLPK